MLERQWKSTSLEAVRVSYRKACRVANKLITESRRAFYAKRVTDSSRDPHALWRCVKGLLHAKSSAVDHEKGMCDRFSSFFNDKIAKAKAKVASMRALITPDPLSSQ